MTTDNLSTPDVLITELAVPEVAIEEEVVAIQENTISALGRLTGTESPHHGNNNNNNIINSNSSDQPTTPSSKPSKAKRSVLFDTVTIYHFSRSQGFSSIPSQGGSTLGMTRRHFFKRKLSVDLFEEVRRRSRKEILMKIKLDKNHRTRRSVALEGVKLDSCTSNPPSPSTSTKSSASTSSTSPSSSASSSSTTSSSSSSGSSSSSSPNSDSDSSFSYSDNSDISDSDMEIDIFCQPIGVNLRRSLLRNSGVISIDPKERKECDVIRDSRGRSGCRCVNQCIPNLCECSLLGVNCHVDRISYPCGCISTGCQNPQGSELARPKTKTNL